MNSDLALVRDGKKFLWDGRALETRGEAAGLAGSYRNDNSEVCSEKTAIFRRSPALPDFLASFHAWG